MQDNANTEANPSIKVSQWLACYSKAEGIIALSCTATGGEISGVGLILNTQMGATLASIYVELSNDNESVTPALNIPAGNLKLGDKVSGVVSGVAGGKHFFFQKGLIIEECTPPEDGEQPA